VSWYFQTCTITQLCLDQVVNYAAVAGTLQKKLRPLLTLSMWDCYHNLGKRFYVLSSWINNFNLFRTLVHLSYCCRQVCIIAGHFFTPKHQFCRSWMLSCSSFVFSTAGRIPSFPYPYILPLFSSYLGPINSLSHAYSFIFLLKNT